ncbi:MAG: hypothetical protein ACLP59_01655 [Bryobacteraceae bacterium]
MLYRRAAWIGLSILAMIPPVAGQEGPKRSFEVSSTQHVAFAAGGVIRLQNSHGYLAVEGWDEPEVEIIVTKSTNGFYEPGQKDRATERLSLVSVSTRPTEKDVTISTVPGRKKLLVVSWPFTKRRGVTAEYSIRVPRDSKLEVTQDNGYVWVSDVTGDIQVHSHTGDMIVMLPDPGPYAIDARTGMGTISSDFAGKGHKQLLVGTHFSYAGQTPKRRVDLRMGRGSISILNGPPSGPFWKE